MISKVDVARRNFLKSRVLAGAAALMAPRVEASEFAVEASGARLPLSANVLGL